MQLQNAYFCNRCIHCRACSDACVNKLITIDENNLTVDYSKCKMCLSCVDTCCTGALRQIGKQYTAEELMKEIMKDEPFYRRSGGGVTFSGGEPLIQLDFLIEVSELCRAKDVNIAIETTGHVDPKSLERVAGYLDLVYYDIKHIDSAKHKELTGVGNETILSNLRMLSRIHNNIIVRTPIVPGCNDDAHNLCATADFCVECGIDRFEMLPYHNLGSKKYEQIGESYTLGDLEAPSRETMERLCNMVNEHIGDPEFKCEIVD